MLASKELHEESYEPKVYQGYWEKLKLGLKVGRLYDNPSLENMIQWSAADYKETKHGSYSFYSKIKNRSAKNTYIVEGYEKIGLHQQPISTGAALILSKQVNDYLKNKEVIKVDRIMGDNLRTSFKCRLYITKRYSRIAAMWSQTLAKPLEHNSNPDFVAVYVPEWPERIIFCEPTVGITYILGTDYFGEAKKAFLRKAMYFTKKQGGLGLHAGSKILRIKDKQGILKDVGFVLFGLSGTGKTTLTIHDHNLIGEEKVTVKQDDVVLMQADGACLGTETGFYIKTEGLNESQKVLYDASLLPTSLFENVMVKKDGTIDFDNTELTSNGRGIVLRSDVKGTDEDLNLPIANKIIFITRRDDVVPVLAKLSPEQAAAFFMLGESIETSAGDPTKAGQSKRVVGTNPFIVGPEEEEGHRFLEILKANPDIECFLLNTGSIGKKQGQDAQKITIKVSTELLKHIAKEDIDYRLDPAWGYLVPKTVPGLELEEYNPENYYTAAEYKILSEKLRLERIKWLAQFKDLKKEIKEAFNSCGE